MKGGVIPRIPPAIEPALREEGSCGGRTGYPMMT